MLLVSSINYLKISSFKYNLSTYFSLYKNMLVVSIGCGHCKVSKPEYAKAAQSLRLEAPSSRLAAVDCVRYGAVKIHKA